MKVKLSFVLLSMCIFMINCTEPDPKTDPKPDPVTPTSSSVNTDGCKSSHRSTRAGKDDCIEYSYDGKSVLSITHINAAFNCCPGTFSTVPTISNGVITIEEKESDALCSCNCLYDLTYQISNISPGKYTLKIIEPYVDPAADKLESLIDLTSSTSGKFCVNRLEYPWGI